MATSDFLGSSSCAISQSRSTPYPRFWTLAATLRDNGCSILVVSHLAYDTARLDSLYGLDAGKLTEAKRVTGDVADSGVTP